MASEAPSDCTNASSVACGLAEVCKRAVERSRHRLGGASSRLGFLHQLRRRKDLERNASSQQRGHEHQAERQQQPRSKRKSFPHLGYSNPRNPRFLFSNIANGLFNPEGNGMMQNSGRSATKVLIVDDHPVVLSGCRSLFASDNTVKIDEATDAKSGHRAYVREAARRHGDRYQASGCLRLRTDAAHPQGRSGRQDHHVQHE